MQPTTGSTPPPSSRKGELVAGLVKTNAMERARATKQDEKAARRGGRDAGGQSV